MIEQGFWNENHKRSTIEENEQEGNEEELNLLSF